MSEWWWRNPNARPIKGWRMEITTKDKNKRKGDTYHHVHLEMRHWDIPDDADPEVLLEVLDALASGVRAAGMTADVTLTREEKR